MRIDFISFVNNRMFNPICATHTYTHTHAQARTCSCSCPWFNCYTIKRWNTASFHSIRIFLLFYTFSSFCKGILLPLALSLPHTHTHTQNTMSPLHYHKAAKTLRFFSVALFSFLFACLVEFYLLMFSLPSSLFLSLIFLRVCVFFSIDLNNLIE